MKDTSFASAFGFTSMKLQYAFITKLPEYMIDSKESPTVEWTFIGYNFSIDEKTF